MKKRSSRKLCLSSETLRHLSSPEVRGIGGAGFDFERKATGPDDDTCYWGCSHTCPDPDVATHPVNR